MKKSKDMRVYLDTAATSFKKPDCVCKAVRHFMRNIAASPGRSTHRLGIKASKLLEDTRNKTADFFGVDNPLNIVFTSNCTEALNLAILGILKSNDHVIVSGVEHNSVMRPLSAMTHQRNISFTVLNADQWGMTALDELKKAIQANTALIIMTHASNVTGTIQPIEQCGRIAKEYGIPFLVDAAQTDGCIPIKINKLPIDMFAFSAHKGMLGPQGLGGLYIREGINLVPLKYGGTGSSSTEITQPEFRPDKYESGTPNTPGIAGFSAALDFIVSVSVERIREKIIKTGKHILEGLSAIDKLEINSSKNMAENIGIFSFSVKNKDAGKIAEQLDNHYGIMTRVGLHCAPTAHKSIGTYPEGTIRASIGYYTNIEEVEYFIKALEKISNEP